MSINEFSAAMRNQAIKNWFGTEDSKIDSKRITDINTILNPVNLYRTQEQTAEKTSFVITKDTVKELLIQFGKVAPDDPNIDKLAQGYFSEFKTTDVSRANRKQIKVKLSNDNSIPAIYFPKISFDSITNLVNGVIGLDAGELQTKYQKGHVIGLASELLQVTSNRIGDIDARGTAGAGAPTTIAKDTIIKSLDTVIAYYKRMDLASANLQPAKDVSVYASVNKKINKQGVTGYLVELQLEGVNQESGAEVQKTIVALRNIFNPLKFASEKKTLDAIDKIITKIKDPIFVQDLMNIKSSPSFKDMIFTNLVGALTGKSTDQAYSVPKTKIHQEKTPKLDTTELRTEISKSIKEVETLKVKVKRQATLRKLGGQFFSLAALQVILNQQLADQIQANMGKGDSTRVLNYRTGRFADSVQVERMSMSREGMITAFYNYMKAPYGTFEPGFKQGSPATRNPRLLISKSIREIAATVVNNRMRAVLI